MANENDGDTITNSEGDEENLASSDQQSATAGQKVFCDSVHGHISLHPLLVKIIDTPQFQRMRNIKQLGSAYFVFPGASHNRFEHSIGTAYLAGKLARTIQRKQPELEVNDTDVLCVEIAGLCFSLGYGPFSYLYKIFLKRVKNGCRWKRKKASWKMLKYLLKENNLRSLLDEKDIVFVKELIKGPSTNISDPNAWPYKGRGRDKGFLYDIVSNKRNGVDVVKWDYIARDCHHLGIRNSFDHNRFMKFVKVLPVGKEEGEQVLQICARNKECENLYEMFHMRSVLHRRAYQHSVAKAIDCMIVDAMKSADQHLKIPGEVENEETMMRKISDCRKDPVAYSNLTDGIFERILYSTEPDLKSASEILKRVSQRQLYKLIGYIKWSEKNDKEISLQIYDHNGTKQCGKPIKRDEREPPLPNIYEQETLPQIISWAESDQLILNDLTSCVRDVDYGKKNKNPVQDFMFFNKSEPKKAYPIPQEDVSPTLAKKFQEREILIFCKDIDKADEARKCFKKWYTHMEGGVIERDENHEQQESIQTTKRSHDGGEENSGDTKRIRNDSKTDLCAT